MGVQITGLDEVQASLDALDDGLQELPERAADPVHDAIVSHVRARASQIPRDSGALARSLTNPRDRAHVFVVDGTTIRYGSTLPQAASPYVAPRIPLPSASSLVLAVGDAVDELIDEAFEP